jgi:hypothetical protein
MAIDAEGKGFQVWKFCNKNWQAETMEYDGDYH